MIVHSPMRILTSSLLRAISAPVWLTIEALHRRQLKRCKVLKVVLSPKNIQLWTQDSDQWVVLQNVCTESHISTVWLIVQAVPLGWARVWAFRKLLLELKRAGKTVMVLIETSDARALWMTACADKIWIQHGVELFWPGIGGRHTFYGAFLERYGVRADIESAGAFKSFGEAYVRTEPSEQNREQLESLYGSVMNRMLEDLSFDTGVDQTVLIEALKVSPISTEKLNSIGLVEGEGDRYSIEERVKEYVDGESSFVSFERHLRCFKRVRRWKWGGLKSSIALVHLFGSITDFDTDQEGVVADRVTTKLEYLADQDNIHAVVLNINSPGGSAIASDRIARAIERLQQRKKVIAYMDNVAASGGYYIASVCDWIWSTPQTITGSIGVVGGKLVVGQALEKQGIQMHQISVGGESDFLDVWQPFSDEQRLRFRSFLQRTYDRFTGVVSKGRRLSKEGVESVAQGRVWTGTQAIEGGLVDQLGTLKDCLDDLAQHLQMSTDSVQVVHIRDRVGGWKRWRKRVFGISSASPRDLLLKHVPTWIGLVQTHPGEALLVLPFEVDEEGT